MKFKSLSIHWWLAAIVLVPVLGYMMRATWVQTFPPTEPVVPEAITRQGTQLVKSLRCEGTTRAGLRCKNWTKDASHLCFVHRRQRQAEPTRYMSAT